MMNAESLKEAIKRELPELLREDPELRAFILEVTRREYAEREETRDRFYDILNELRREREERARAWEEYKQARDREWREYMAGEAAKWEEQKRKDEEHNRKWDEQNQKWEEQNQKWEEQNSKWEEQRVEQNRKWDEQNDKWKEQNRKWEEQRVEQNRKWDEQNDKWKEQNRKWEEQRVEQNRKWDEQNQKWAELRVEQNLKWEEAGKRFDKLHEEIMAQAQKHDRSIGALGSRWGMQSEKAFRDALAGILEKSFGVQVVNVNDFDDQGEVFGRPEQVELDVIVKNGLLLICELKSSIDKAGMYMFERKARFYEKRHQRTADRLLVISPMIDARAQKVAERLGIETFGDSTDVKEI